MKRIETRREKYLKDKNANVKIPMGIAYEAGYRDGCIDAAEEFKLGGWVAKAMKVKDLPDREDNE